MLCSVTGAVSSLSLSVPCKELCIVQTSLELETLRYHLKKTFKLFRCHIQSPFQILILSASQFFPGNGEKLPSYSTWGSLGNPTQFQRQPLLNPLSAQRVQHRLGIVTPSIEPRTLLILYRTIQSCSGYNY